MSYGFFPNFGLQLPSTPLAQGYTPMLEEGLGSADIAPVGTGQVNQDMSLNDRTQQVLDQANTAINQSTMSESIADFFTPKPLVSPPFLDIFAEDPVVDRSVSAIVPGLTADVFAPGDMPRTEQTDMPQPPLMFDTAFGDESFDILPSGDPFAMPEKSDISPEGFYGQSEVRGTEAGPPEFGQEEVVDEEAATQEATIAGGDQRNKAVEAELEEAGFNTPGKKAVKTALDEYLSQARPGVDPKNYDEYIKEFGEATGLDVSGEPDNKMALMAFGLALMQNKAGKGFDVGEMLSSVGEAGEKAMPALQKAREQAKAIRAKAGEYAISRKKEDQAAAMAREDFYIIPKSENGGPLAVAKAIASGKGDFARLNSYEINNLDKNEQFNQEYMIVKPSDYNDMVTELLKEPETKDLFMGSIKEVPLFSGAPDSVKIGIQPFDFNNPEARKYQGSAMVSYGGDNAVNYVRRMEQGYTNGVEKFQALADLINETGTSAGPQARSAIVQGLRNLGFDAGEDTDPVKQIQIMLTELKARNAAEILGESGKTLSDNDRRMVSDIVGGISLTEGDEASLIRKLDRLSKAILGARQQDLEEAYKNLENLNVPFTPGIDFGNVSAPTFSLPTIEDEEGVIYDVTSPSSSANPLAQAAQ